MPIQKMKSSGGLGGSKAAAVGVGIATGGLAGGALNLLSANNPSMGAIIRAAQLGKDAKEAVAPEYSSIGVARTGVGGTVGLGGQEMVEALGPTAPLPTRGPNLGVIPQDNPLARRLNVGSQDPAAAVEEGLAGLRQLREQYPDIYGSIAEEAAPALLKAKHFNLKGRQ